MLFRASLALVLSLIIVPSVTRQVPTGISRRTPLMHPPDGPSATTTLPSTRVWNNQGGGIEKTQRLERRARPACDSEPGWTYSTSTRYYTEPGDYFSLALHNGISSAEGVRDSTTADEDAGRVVAILNELVVSVDIDNGTEAYTYEAFNPRGPVVMDTQGNAFISWYGSGSAAGFNSFSPNGTKRFATFCPRSMNHNYDFSPIAVLTGNAKGGELVAGCFLWDTVYQSMLVDIGADPDASTPAWVVRTCSYATTPLVLEDHALRPPPHVLADNRAAGVALVVAGSCKDGSALRIVTREAGETVLEMSTGPGDFNDATLHIAATALPWEGGLTPRHRRSNPHSNSSLDPAPSHTTADDDDGNLLLFSLTPGGSLCVYGVNNSMDWSRRLRPLGCNFVVANPRVGGISGQLDRGRVVLDPASGHVFVQAHSAPLQRSVPERWTLAAVAVTVSEAFVADVRVVWNTSVETDPTDALFDTSLNMQLALGTLNDNDGGDGNNETDTNPNSNPNSHGTGRTVLLVPRGVNHNDVVALDALHGPKGEGRHAVQVARTEFAPRAVGTDTLGAMYVAGVEGYRAGGGEAESDGVDRLVRVEKWGCEEVLKKFEPL
eukprot:m.77966 g.77966  ORF g.77966 m.77966 type:complete len:606 (+) comp9179_c0_seq2:129-1946(+)